MQLPEGNLMNRDTMLTVGIAVISALVIVLNAYGFSLGITTVLPHLFYIPIIITAYYFPRRGVLFTIALSIIYCGTGCLLFHIADIPSIVGRIVIFILVAATVSFLTLRLSESETRFRGFVERSSDLIILSDTAARITYVSPSVRKILKYEPEELIGKTPQDILHPDDVHLIDKAVADSRLGPMKDAVTLRCRMKGGNYAVIEFFGAPVTSRGDLVGMQVIGRDITERMKAEDELRDTTRRLGDIVEFLPDPTFVIDRNGNVVAWNRAIEELTGIPKDTILGKGDYEYSVWFYGDQRPVLIDMVLKGDMDAIRTAYPRFRQHRDIILAEAVTARPGREPIDFWLTATPLFSKEGEITGAIESLRNVTHQKAISRALKESSTYLDAVINTMANPLFIKNQEHRFVKVNNSFCQFAGLTRESLIGKTDYDFFKKEEADVYRQKDEEVFLTGRESENEETLTDSSGVTHTIVTKKTRYVNSAGEMFIVGIIHDITERKKILLSLQQALKKLNMLSSITRHDILNQLMSLRAFLELTREQTTDPEVLGFISFQEKAAEAIQRQIEFTRVYDKLGITSPQWQDVREIFLSAESQLHLGAITVNLTVPPVRVYADPLIEKVFYNLLENTLRHGGTVTEVTLSGDETQDGFIITYHDNGAGINPADRAYLFQKGFGRNTGLGLFLSREILSITGITIAETGEGKAGAWFEIHIPKGAYRIAGK